MWYLFNGLLYVPKGIAGQFSVYRQKSLSGLLCLNAD